MRARYKLTEYLSDIIRKFKDENLGMSYENFATVINLKSSAVHYICHKTRRSFLSPELLYIFFVCEYNFTLFVEKFPRMEKILEAAISNGDFEEGTTLKRLFGTKSDIKEDKNPTLAMPPVEIFTERKCVVKVDGYANDTLFDEALFPDNLKYVPSPINSDFNDIVTEDELNRINNYIVERLETLFEECNKHQLKTEYWLYAMYFKYKYIAMPPSCWEYIKKHYFKSNRQEHSWLTIFEELGLNRNLTNKDYYADEDEIYFENKENEPMSPTNLPIICYKYKRPKVGKTPEAQKRYRENYYDDEQTLAITGKIKFIHLFNIFFQNLMTEKKMDENTAFIKTCTLLYSHGIEVPFNKANIYQLPVKRNIPLSDASVKFYTMLNDFFAQTKIAKEESDLYMFKHNYMECKDRFISAIAVDFEFIKRLNRNLDAELNQELKRTAEDFESEYLL